MLSIGKIEKDSITEINVRIIGSDNMLSTVIVRVQKGAPVSTHTTHSEFDDPLPGNVQLGLHNGYQTLRDKAYHHHRPQAYEAYVGTENAISLLKLKGPEALLEKIQALEPSVNPIVELVNKYRQQQQQLGAGAQQHNKWTSTGQISSVKQKRVDGRFHTVRRTTYSNPKYPNELRIAKLKDGKRVFVKFAKFAKFAKITDF